MSRSLFDPEDHPPLAAQLAPALRDLADRGVYFGTSSWKYPGWCGSIYTAERYHTRGKFSKTKFDATCLHEYAETFPAVGGDFSFYTFQPADYWDKQFDGLPPAFRMGLKVPDKVTVKTFPHQPRYGASAGLANPSFLDARLFAEAFIRPLEPHRRHVGPIIFEFGTFARSEFDDKAEFFDRLDEFLGALPAGWDYATEIRNREYLGPNYFEVLKRRRVAHVFNAWTRMPTLLDQIALDGAFTADFTVVRALLRHGRTYEQAVTKFQPYEKVQEPDPGTRDALKKIAVRAIDRKERAYQFVNNRLEGNAPGTIAEVVASLPPP